MWFNGACRTAVGLVSRGGYCRKAIGFLTTASTKRMSGPEFHWEEALRDPNPLYRNKVFRGDPYESPDQPRLVYPKRKSPMKRARALIDILHREEQQRRVDDGLAVLPRLLPDFKAGDIIRLKILKPGHPVALDSGTQASPAVFEFFTGICILRRNRGIGSTFVLRNVIDGTPVERGFPVYSPRIVHAELLESRPVRRTKLYYLRDRPNRESSVS